MGKVEQDLLRHLQRQAGARPPQTEPVAETRPSVVSPPANASPETGPAPRSQARTADWKGAGIVGAVFALLFKFKVVLLFLLTKIQFGFAALKMLSLGKILATGATMAISVGAYAQFYPLSTALGLVLLILVHEMGHVIALRWYGVKSTVPLFIPFFGAFVALKEMPRNVHVEAVTALAGPVVGSFGALVCYRVFELTGSGFWASLAYIGFAINLFNMVPISPLDGGRVVKIMTPPMWGIGVLTVCLLLLGGGHAEYCVIIAVLAILALPFLIEAWRAAAANQDYFSVPHKVRMQLSVAYFAMLGLLMLYLVAAHNALLDGRNSF